MEFISSLTEAKLLGGGKHRLKNYTAKDIADLLFLHICVLQILKHEFIGLPEAQKYAKGIGSLSNFDHFYMARNEVYIFAHVLIGKYAERQQELLKEPEASKLFLERVKINVPRFKMFVRSILSGRNDESMERRFLLELEHDLMINDIYFRSVRRLVSTWDKISHSTRVLVMTRLLQIFRRTARRSELMNILEYVAKKTKLENKSLKPLDANPEKDKKEKVKKPKKFGFLKSLATVGVGAAGGYALTRRKKKA